LFAFARERVSLFGTDLDNAQDTVRSVSLFETVVRP